MKTLTDSVHPQREDKNKPVVRAVLCPCAPAALCPFPSPAAPHPPRPGPLGSHKSRGRRGETSLVSTTTSTSNRSNSSLCVTPATRRKMGLKLLPSVHIRQSALALHAACSYPTITPSTSLHTRPAALLLLETRSSTTSAPAHPTGCERLTA